MKFVTLLFFFIVTNSYAAVCSQEMQALQHNRHGYVELKTSNFDTGFSALEKKMIHKVVTIQDYLAANSVEESFENFGGSADGEIVYFKVGRKVIAKVHYWPGDNEYGAYVEVVGTKVLVHAEIGDGDIYCL
ncbi:MAG: hypothetical protein V4598_13365 [Bdellovibrionota bacterium]